MPSRSWFYAANGQQQGPFPEEQLRDLIARGTVRADTLVWSEGMAGWQKAGEIPGLMSMPPGPPSIAQPGGPPAYPGGYAGPAGGGSLAIDFGIWEFVWRSLVLLIGLAFIIPTPWVLVWYNKWIVSRIHVPGRPNLSFTGTAMTVAIWYFGFIAFVIVIAIIGAFTEIEWLNNLIYIVQIVLYWLFLKWLVANLASNGQSLGLSFSGSVWAYAGWSILAVISVITIIGWAWVYSAMMRWICRNIQGTRREVVFTGTGLEFLWRSIVAVIGFMFIIPIPWVYRWIMQWMASQTKLVERGAMANA
ncbi:DUF4339 domain-containing protein [Bradyrhizobium lablabi]|uniref:DUF4339 domain-containing protein n=1 Tax=Bradyrhizobium lablabi TaxID=722472 RepID=UPI001BA85362|nr:DUF4339 domain-containing protein [Bradyrhizobium lablabi]MBR1123359.1 DUF4339 domain-containing protein [Bradyrhizobium lablabi]